jgi:hypothetical protein
MKFDRRFRRRKYKSKDGSIPHNFTKVFHFTKVQFPFGIFKNTLEIAAHHFCNTLAKKQKTLTIRIEIPGFQKKNSLISQSNTKLPS